MNFDRDKLGVNINTHIVASYPMSGTERYYVTDTIYITSLLLRHLRYTHISNNTLQRNSELLIAFLGIVKYTNRNCWLNGMEEALDFYFPF